MSVVNTDRDTPGPRRAGRLPLLAAALCVSATLVAAGPASARDYARLASAPWPDAVQRIAFGSCFKAQRDDDRIWQAVAASRPDVFVFAGDTLYPDKDDSQASLPRLRAAYDALASNAGFASLRSATPVLPIWDDHDYGRNDGGADFPFRAQSERLFLERWGIGAEDERARRPGLYTSEVVGEPGRRVQLIILDTRYFRSPLRATDARGSAGRERYLPDPDPAKTMLGDAQWQWLAEQIGEPAELRLIVSTIQVLADGHGWEGWRQLPAERERLFALLRDADATPIVLLSGDRHVAGFYERDIGRREALLEFTSSALNNTIPFPYRRNTLAEAGPHRLGELYGEANFGALDLDWEQGVLALEMRDRDGQVVRRLERSLRQAD